MGYNSGALAAGANLSDLPSAATARNNLGILTELWLPTGALAQTVSRDSVSSTVTPAVGTVQMAGIALAAGMTVTSITFCVAVGITSPTHREYGIYAADGVTILGRTGDLTNTALATNSSVAVLLTTPYPVPASGRFYLGIVYQGSALTLRSTATTGAANGVAPIRSATSDAGVNTLQSPGAALTTQLGTAWAWVS